MIKYLTSLLIIVVCSYTTYGQLKDVTFSGMIGGLQNEKIALIKDNGESRELLDSIQLKNGEFKWEGKIEQAFAVDLVLPKRRTAQFFLSPGKNNLFVHVKDCQYGFLIGKLTVSSLISFNILNNTSCSFIILSLSPMNHKNTLRMNIKLNIQQI